MFVRTKKIKNKPYAYLVENTWVDGSSKQVVKQYLGRIYEAPPTPPADLTNVQPQQILPTVIQHELAQLPEIDVDVDEHTVKKSSRDVVVALNGGYLCGYTLNELFSSLHVADEQRPGLALAQALAQVGLRVDKKDFIRLYMHFQS